MTSSLPDQPAPQVPFQPAPQVLFQTAPDVLFQAVIVPHRSLSLTGLRVLLGAVLVCCLVSASVFALVGAWPVGLFSGAELILAGLLFRLHLRAARASEMLVLSHASLRLVRTSPQGKVNTKTLPTDWMQIHLQERPGRVPALLLLGHNLREEIGQALGEDAKRDLATALAAALHRRRNPTFDNPQLR
jgi:uncharacterized membrane protein